MDASSTRLSALALFLASVGCGATIDSTAATSSSGSGGASSSASAGGAGGAMTGGGGASTGGGSAAGGGGSGDCANAFLMLTLDSGDPPPVLSLNDVCPNSWGSTDTTHVVGYVGVTGPGPGGMMDFFIDACRQNGPEHFDLGVPLYDVGTQATDSAGLQFSGASWQTAHGIDVTVTAFGAVGATIDGTLDGTMKDGVSTHHVSGSFSVCRVNDFLPP